MKTIQDSFNRIQEIKAEQKVIKAQYKDALAATGEHKNIADKIKELRERKKQIEIEARRDMAAEFTRLEKLKQDLAGEQELLSSQALTSYIKGETIGVTDSNNISYEPIFTVRFRKVT